MDEDEEFDSSESNCPHGKVHETPYQTLGGQHALEDTGLGDTVVMTWDKEPGRGLSTAEEAVVTCNKRCRGSSLEKCLEMVVGNDNSKKETCGIAKRFS